MANGKFINPLKSTSGGTSRSTAMLMKSGQTTSFNTGDDGDYEDGRGTDFFTLAENNPFGNTNRFTDIAGGQTYTNNIILDWSTFNGTNVVMWHRTVQTAAAWATAISNCTALSVGGYTSGWKLPNTMQYFSLMLWENSCTNKFNYSPFNITGTFWTSNTYIGSSTLAWYIDTGNNHTYNAAKTLAKSFFACRIGTVSGTTIT